MTQSKLKRIIHELVETYFKAATVTWGMIKTVSPNVPHILLNMSDITRPYQPITQNINGVSCYCYPSKTTLQIDLYTKGIKRGGGVGIRSAYENTAVSDLTDFVNFLNSEYVSDWSEVHDVSVLANNVTDLTAVINETTWDYRAMVEVEIGFTQTAVGHAAIMYENGIPYHSNGVPMFDGEGYELDRNGNRLPKPPLPLNPDGVPIYPEFQPSPSGGGTQTLAEKSTGWFEQVESPKFTK